ncbi:protein-glutamate O-methyltransferase CheR [Brachyspira pilosicoli]|uniref:CheR family methyltransferase n=1 Tax=Brachyspira pilosicoli TaxID=52584 RepID=UPI001CA55AEE|nr:protein-glutamate O-methyltransferase CheR [Brachyspira pilosicoli]MBW5396517.1 protein-glutamate O-methyltransferase CheR [Brachyspira pilosicoli]
MSNNGLTEEYLELFKEFIYNKSGIRFNLINQVILESRIESSMKERNIFNVGDYFHLVSTDKQELKLFLDNITTNLTKFFRTESNFNLLKNKVLPIVLNNKKYSEPIYIWSSGCSTGEEPYSIAMTCLETPNLYRNNVKIYATDISMQSLEVAKIGIYDKDKVTNISDEYLTKYFDEMPNGKYKVKDDVKSMVTFEYHNLITPNNRYLNIDIVFCRNVLIYFDNESVKLTVNRFYDILNKHGFLFIGHSESLFGLDTKFKFNNIDNSIVYTKSEEVF